MLDSTSSILDDASLLKTTAYVDGRWVAAASGQSRPLFNPSTGALRASLPQLSAAETASAIEAADRGLSGWRSKSGKERSILLRRWFDLIVASKDDLARLIVVEEGKPFVEAQGEIGYAASFIEWFAEEAKRVSGDVMASPERGRRILTLEQPVGVCAAITPWNFPAAMITRKVAAALAAGCTMVVKPAEQTPLTALALAALAERAEIPAGVFNVVIGDAREVGGELSRNPLVRKITFTGSTDGQRHGVRPCGLSVR